MATTFFTAVTTLYEPFVLPYAVSVLHHNDDAAVEICLEDPARFQAANAAALAIIAGYFPDRLLLRGGCFAGIRGSSVRFLETPILRSEFAYIGDVDILVLDHDVTAQHLAHMERTGLPYSNRLRPPKRAGLNSLTGLHFTSMEAHYPLSLPPDWDFENGNAEQLLFKLVEAKGLPLPAETDTFRPSHGIHLSVKRTPTRAADAGPPWQIPAGAVDGYLALWQTASWQEVAEHFHPAFRALLLVLETALQVQDRDRTIYRRREARAFWETLAINGVAPCAIAADHPSDVQQDADHRDDGRSTEQLTQEVRAHLDLVDELLLRLREQVSSEAALGADANLRTSAQIQDDLKSLGEDAESLRIPRSVASLEGQAGNCADQLANRAVSPLTVHALLASAATESSAISKSSIEQFERERSRLIRAGYLDDAMALQTTRLAEDPTNPRLHHQMSYLLRAKKDNASALEYELKACALAPEEPSYRRTAARLYSILGDRAQAVGMTEQVIALEEKQRLDFARAQEVAKTVFAERIRSIVGDRLRSWPYDTRRTPDTPLADGLLHAHVVDTVPGWRQHVTARYGVGEIATVDGVGRFVIDSLADTHQKRWVRGMVWELPILALLLEMAARCDPAATIVDIGANVGAHTVPLSRAFGGTVVASEPVEENVRRLREHLTLNDVDNCQILAKACSRESGAGQMHGFRAEDSGRAKLEVNGKGPIDVTTLDVESGRLGRPVAVVKIDVEGHEQAVIEGGLETLRRHRPIVVCELLNKSSDVPRIMSDLGYDALHFFRSDWVFCPR